MIRFLTVIFLLFPLCVWGATHDIRSNKAKHVRTSTSNFNNMLSPSDTTVQKALDTIDDKITSSAPNAPTDSGDKGTIAYDSSYLYICVGNNSWKRVSLSTWAPSNDYLLMETGDFLLLENGDKIILE